MAIHSADRSGGPLITFAVDEAKVTEAVSRGLASSIGSVEEAVRAALRVVRNELTGVFDFSQYFVDVDRLAQKVRDVLDYESDWWTTGNAEDVIKSYRALEATSKKAAQAIRLEYSNFDQLMNKAINMAPAVAESFDVDKIKEARAVFEELDKLGFNANERFSDILKNEQEVERLTEECQRLEERITRVLDDLHEAQAEADRLRIETKEEQFNGLVNSAKDEFKAFLTANGISTGEFKAGGQFDQMFRDIESGAKTSSQAVADFKAKFTNLLPADAINGVDTFLAKMEALTTKIDSMQAEIAGLKAPAAETAGIGIAEAAEEGTRALAAEGEQIRGVAEMKPELDGLTALLVSLMRAGGEAGESVSGLTSELMPLVASIKELSGQDQTNLMSLNGIFRGLSEINGFKFSSTGSENLIAFINSIKGIDGLPKLRELSGVSLKGFSDLTIRKSSLENLATYLPVIAGVNVDNLERLQHIDLSSLSDIKVPEITGGSIDNLAKLSDSLKTVADSARILSDAMDTVGTSSTAALSHSQLTGILKANIDGAIPGPGVGRARGGLSALGFSDEDADLLARKLEDMYGRINDVDVKWTETGDGVRQVSQITVHALDENNNKLSETLDYIERIDEEGRIIPDVVSRGNVNLKFKDPAEERRMNAAWESRNRDTISSGVTREQLIEEENRAYGQRARLLREIATEEERVAQREIDLIDAGEDAREEKELENAIKSVNAVREEQKSLEADMARAHDAAAANARRRAEEEAENARKQEASLLREQEAAQRVEETYKNLSTSMANALGGNDRSLGVLPEESARVIADYSAQLSDLHRQWENGEIDLAKYKSEVSRLSGEYARAVDAAKNLIAQEKAKSAQVKRGVTEENTRITLQKKLSDETTKAAKVLRDYSAAEHSKNAASREAYANIQGLIPKMDELNARIKNGDITTEEAIRLQKEYSAALSGSIAAVTQSGDAHMTAFGKIAKAVKTHLTTLSATMIIGTIMREARQMVQTVTEIDTAMTELRKVTDETEERYVRFLDNAADRAKNLSATISDTVTATAGFARLDLTIDEAEKAADAAIVYKAVGDGIEDINDASQSIISTMKAFGIEASDAMTIVDKFNEVGNRYAISSQGVGEALLRSAAAMQAANNTLDETIGLATAANTILQNPQSVGTMLKTVSMYVRAAKTELEEAGEETEGIAESTGKLRELVKQITKEGGKAVDIMADENTFKSTYQIMKEISEVWDNISDANQAALLEKLGGKRNANAIAAMLENFEIAEQAMQTAAGSAGSAMNELEKFQKSIEGHVVAFKTAYQELAQTLIDGDLVKNAIDLGTTLINILTKIVDLIDKIGGMKTIAAIAGASGLITLVDSANKAGGVINLLTNSLSRLSPAIASVIGALSSGGGLAGAFSVLAASINPATLAIAAAAGSIALLAAVRSKHKRAQEELRLQIQQSAEAATEEAKEITSLVREYDAASKAYESDKDKKDDLTDATNKLLEKLGVEKERVNALAHAYGGLDNAIKQVTLDKLQEKLDDVENEYWEKRRELTDSLQPSLFDRIRYGERSGRIVFDANEYSDDYYKAIAAFESLQQNGLGSYAKDYIGDRGEVKLKFDFDVGDLSKYGDIKEFSDKLKEAYQRVGEIAGADSEIYNKIYSAYKAVHGQIELIEQDGDKMGDLAVQIQVVSKTLNESAPETYDDFQTTREAIINALRWDKRFIGTQKDVEEAVDSALKEMDGYSFFYGETAEKYQMLRDEQEERNQGLRDYIDRIQEYIRTVKEAENAGLKPDETIFGNIDTNNRQVLTWTEENLERFRSALESWGYTLDDMEEMKDSISTVLGGSEWFGGDNGVEIAFSPILQTDKGPMLLDAKTVREYIWNLFDQAGGEWDASRIIELDARGLEVDGLKIKNLIASIGEDAIRTGEVMHYAGADGAIAGAMEDAQLAAEEFGGSADDLDKCLRDLHGELADGEKKVSEYNRQMEALAENTSAAASNPFPIISKFNSEIGVIREALAEFNSSNVVTNETLLRLNETFGDENKLVEILNGKLVLNTDEVNKLVTSLRDQYGMQAAVAGATADQIEALDSLASSTMTVKEAAEDPTAALNELSKVLKDMGKGIELSTEDTMSLVKKYPQLRDKIIKTANGYKVEEAAIRDLIRAKADLLTMNEREIGLESSRSSLVSSSNSGLNQAKAIDAIFSEFASKNGKNITSMKQFLNAYQEKFGHAFAADTDSEGGGGLGGFVGDYKAYTDYVKKKIEYYKNGLKDAVTLDMFVEDYLSETGPLEGYDPSKEEKASKTSSTKEETQFEKDYKAHQHYLAMDRETTEQYLNWLDGAYKASYARGEMELDDYYKYEEEIYEGRKQLFQTSLDEMQHQIDLLEHQTGDTYDKQAAIYMQMQKAVHAQAESLRARGIKENDEMIRELQDQWWSYEEAIRQLREQSFDDWLNDQKFTIDLQKKNKESTDAILQSWRVVLGSLNDELKYYLSVGYDKTSDVVQKIMNEIDSAKEEMISVLEEVVSKANEVVDGFQNVYTTLTNAASEYASTGYLSVDSLQSILELGPKYLAMLEDENGQLVINERNLQLVISARTNEMAAETALSYAKQVLLATESGEVDKLRELADVQSASSNATWDMAYATLGYAKALGAAKGIEESFYDNAISYVTKMQSVTQTAMASISAYYETLNAGYVSQADGLETILKLTEDMIKQENDDKIDALEKEKEAYKDIIDEKKELLRIAKEQADHDKDQADKLKEIAELQSRIDQLALDDSREAAAQRSQLEAELLEKQKALADEQGDYAYDAQVDALDKQYEAFEDTQDKEEKRLKEELNSAEKLYQAAIERIENNWDTLYQELLDWNYNYGLMLAPLYGNV